MTGKVGGKRESVKQTNGHYQGSRRGEDSNVM